MIDVEIGGGDWVSQAPDAEALARQAAQASLAAVDARDGSLAILLTDDATVKALNSRFRGQDKPTNVLSFPAAANPEGHLGDIALAFGVCAAEAADQGKPLKAHLQHLVAHGALHLLGYDHMSESEAQEMEDLERVILAGLGVADPYAAPQGDHG